MEKPAGSFWTALVSTVPTDLGKRILYAGAVLLLFGYVTERPSLFAGASLLLALYAVGHLGAAYAARSLEVDWECPARVYAAEPFALTLVLRNRGAALVTGIEVFEPPPAGDRPAVVATGVAGGASVSLDVRGTVRRRGFHRLAPPRVSISWPLLIACSTRIAAGERDVLAYPRRIPVPSRALRSGAAEISLRERVSSVPRGGEIFRGVREWSPGDPPRAIAWRASARHGALLTREFEREDAGRAVVLLDADARDVPATYRTAAVERACSLAASLVLRLRADGRRTAFAAFSPEPVFLPSASGPRALGRVLETLALLEAPSRRTPRRDPLSLVPSTTLRGARVLLVKAGIGPPLATRDPRGFEVLVLPALRATFQQEGAR